MWEITWSERTVATADLKPYERNPRKISPASMEKLKTSLTASGYHQRILTQPDGTVIGGHQRIKALTELGITSVTVLVPSRELTTDEFRRILVQDNLPFGEFDYAILADDFDVDELTDWGMPKEWIAKIPDVLNAGLTDENEVPETPSDPRTKLGDVWIMGNHRIICGDSTSADVVAKLLGDVKPHLMVTDPPYGVEYDADWRLKAGINKAHQTLADGKVMNDDKADWREAWALFPGNIAYVWHGGLHTQTVAESLNKCDFKLRAQIIWAKQSLVMGRGDYHWQHEPCWYAVKGTGNWKGDRKQTTLWQIQNMHRTQGNVDDGKTSHSTQKPVECMKRPMENNSSPGQAIYEPFSGSGTTIIAGEMTGRHVYAIELSPAYVDVAVKRWQNFSGKRATLEATGEAFDV